MLCTSSLFYESLVFFTAFISERKLILLALYDREIDCECYFFFALLYLEGDVCTWAFEDAGEFIIRLT